MIICVDVYGFKSRDEYNSKSARSYDDERRRLESWLGDYMQFRKSAEGKNVFISIDSRMSRHNPLYRAWKTKSFTDGDITLHFILFDILYDEKVCLSLGEITEKIDEYDVAEEVVEDVALDDEEETTLLETEELTPVSREDQTHTEEHS